MLAEEILNKLRALTHDQPHLLEGLSTVQEARSLLDVLEKLPPDLLTRQREVLSGFSAPRECEPYDDFVMRSEWKGSRIGKVGCVILAGGQGTRLGWHGPKALYPIMEGKTVLQLHLEKIPSSCPVAVMCSPLNVEEIGAAVKGSQVSLFTQDLLPLLDQNKNWFLEAPGRLCQGPDGNGKVFHYLARSGILEAWRKKGIEHIAVVPIDNPLARPLDPGLIDFHEAHGNEVTVATVLREDPFESVGVLAKSKGAPCVVEYSEIDHELRTARKEDGSLLLSLANINIFIFRIAAAAALAEKKFPWHAAKKNGAWKLETFLFDALPAFKKVPALVYPREEMYSPLKNATGDRSPETVRLALRKTS